MPTPRNTRRTRQSHTAYESWRRKQVAYGRWQPFVDTEPVREHIRSLMAAGISRRRIPVLAGVPDATIVRVLYGAAGRPPSSKIRTEAAEKILNVKATPETLSPRAVVDATGTRRRLQALVALGWSRSKLGQQFEADRNTVGRYMEQDRVFAATAMAVRDLYEKLWDAAPPEEDRWDRSAAVAARREAAARGWAPPMAWDDDTIDDPSAKPHGSAPVDVDPVAVERALAGEPAPLTPAEVAEVVRVATQRGMSAPQIARVTGRTVRSVQRRRAAA